MCAQEGTTEISLTGWNFQKDSFLSNNNSLQKTKGCIVTSLYPRANSLLQMLERILLKILSRMFMLTMAGRRRIPNFRFQLLYLLCLKTLYEKGRH